jgi:hypothetical protein
MIGLGCAVDLVKEGEYLIIRNSKIDMYKGSMRLAVNQWGKVERTDPQDFEPKVLPEPPTLGTTTCFTCLLLFLKSPEHLPDTFRLPAQV